MNWRRRLVEAGTRLLLPEVCASCGLSGAWICDECAGTVRVTDQSQVCRRCGHPAGRGQLGCARCYHWVDTSFEVRSVYEFSGAIRDSILKLKYSGEYARAGWHGTEIARLVVDLGWTPELLIPVPLHPNRLRQRGYNQSQKLAETANNALNTRVVAGLRRNRDTPQQTTLGVDERRLNVAGAFTATMSLAGMHIVLVDDVATTRATLLECAAACRESGAACVRAITLATDV